MQELEQQAFDFLNLLQKYVIFDRNSTPYVSEDAKDDINDILMTAFNEGKLKGAEDSREIFIQILNKWFDVYTSWPYEKDSYIGSLISKIVKEIEDHE